MEFITVEQFREQPKEVQKVFIDWWKCEPYDLYAWSWNRRTNAWCVSVCCDEIQADSINKSKDISTGIPLFTEGQLRKFIEDKLNIKVQFNIHFLTLDYVMTTDDLDKVRVHTGTDCLLQAYWKVACIIAEEEVDG